MSRKKLYTFLFVACVAGYIWLYYNLFIIQPEADGSIGVCLIKHVTNVPCPSCGSTRAVISFFNGHFVESLYWNPIGVILILIMFVLPFWLSYDLLWKKDSFICFYRKAEAMLRKPKIAIPAILLILINWIWNISKGL